MSTDVTMNWVVILTNCLIPMRAESRKEGIPFGFL